MALLPSWFDLQQELLQLIFNHLNYCVDVVRCGAVCTAWRKASMEIYRDFIPRSPPLLLLPHINKEQDGRSLKDLKTDMIHRVHLPEARERWICSCSNGWLLTIGLKWPYDIHLLNPFSRSQVSLPPLNTLQYAHLDKTHVENYIQRTIITSNPCDPDCVVLIIYCWGHGIAYCKPGDEMWTHFAGTNIPFFDIIFYKGEFYATDNIGNLLLLELGPKQNAVKFVVPSNRAYHGTKYLVESLSGDLLLVLRYVQKEWLPGGVNYGEETDVDCKDGVYYTVRFEVLKLDLNEEEWSEVHSLGDEALFVGKDGAISVSARETKACRGNCIYFLDDKWRGYFGGRGLFDLGTKCTKLLLCPSSEDWSLPLHWVTPDI